MLQLPLQAPLEPMSVDIISLIYVVTDVLCSAVFCCFFVFFFMFVHRKTHCKRNNIQILSNPELNKLKKMDGHMVLTEIK